MTKTKNQKPKSNYFDDETEQAIIKYNNSTDPLEREYLFTTYINGPFHKLVENIINRYKFPYVLGTFSYIQKEVVSYLVSVMHRYEGGKGKAFSYFSACAKYHMIMRNNKSYAEHKNFASFQDSSDTQSSMEEALQLETPDEEDRRDLNEFMNVFIEYWEKNLSKHFKKERDIKIAIGIIDLFKRANTIENFNKKYIYIQLKEITNTKTIHITKVINKMKSEVARQRAEFNYYGTVGINKLQPKIK